MVKSLRHTSQCECFSCDELAMCYINTLHTALCYLHMNYLGLPNKDLASEAHTSCTG